MQIELTAEELAKIKQRVIAQVEADLYKQVMSNAQLAANVRNDAVVVVARQLTDKAMATVQVESLIERVSAGIEKRLNALVTTAFKKGVKFTLQEPQ